MEGWGEYNISKATFKVFNGGTVYLRTGKDPDSIVGLTNVRAIWGDEAGKYTLYFWENMQARASFRDCPIMLTTSPYTVNWVYKELIKPTLQGKREDVELIQAASMDNPHFPKEEYLRRQRTMDARRFQMVYGGEWGRMQGLVYDCWDDDINYIDEFNLPVGTKYYAGVDWGYTDPFVIKVRGITPDGRHYGVSEFYKTGLTILDMVQIAKQKKQIFGIQVFYCDPAQPGNIEEFNRHGLTAIAADNDIRKGIDLHYELIKSRRYKEFRGKCPYAADERENYHYPEPDDLRPDQDSKDMVPVKQADHTLDADRYITISTYHRSETLVPRVTDNPEPKQLSNEDRLKKLMKSGEKNRHTENWS